MSSRTKLIRKLWNLMPLSLRVRLIRSVQPTFTASAIALILNEKGQILLLQHLLRSRSGWGLPGGFLKRGEQPETAINRELFEETGIAIHSLRQIRTRTLNWRHIEIIFTAHSSEEPEVKSVEILDAKWFYPDTLPDGLSRDQVQMIMRVFDPKFDKSSSGI